MADRIALAFSSTATGTHRAPMFDRDDRADNAAGSWRSLLHADFTATHLFTESFSHSSPAQISASATIRMAHEQQTLLSHSHSHTTADRQVSRQSCTGGAWSIRPVLRGSFSGGCCDFAPTVHSDSRCGSPVRRCVDRSRREHHRHRAASLASAQQHRDYSCFRLDDIHGATAPCLCGCIERSDQSTIRAAGHRGWRA